MKYRSDGESIFLDPDGYPAITPPWGTLNAIDLNEGTIRWKIPFGEFPELAAKGMKNTGSDNYGGPVVTASGLVFIGGDELRQEVPRLRQADRRAAVGNDAAGGRQRHAVDLFRSNGREYIVIACGGGKNGAPSGSSIVAFALPK